VVSRDLRQSTNFSRNNGHSCREFRIRRTRWVVATSKTLFDRPHDHTRLCNAALGRAREFVESPLDNNPRQAELKSNIVTENPQKKKNSKTSLLLLPRSPRRSVKSRSKHTNHPPPNPRERHPRAQHASRFRLKSNLYSTKIRIILLPPSYQAKSMALSLYCKHPFDSFAAVTIV
jgi:hypothetical protein